jgi:hypothetical protein
MIKIMKKGPIASGQANRERHDTFCVEFSEYLM